MAMESPLFLSKVECPVCGTVNEYETIRVGAYTEGERLTDFCPSYIKWRNPKYQKYHPLLFFAATCSACYYTREFNSKFKEWGRDNNFRQYRLKSIKERHLADLAEDSSFVKQIGQMIDTEKYPDESAVLKLLLAAYDELLYEHPSNLDLGRFYLRAAWMFRHINTEVSGETAIGEAKPAHLEDLEKGASDTKIWLAGFSRNIDYLKSAGEAFTESHGDTTNGRFSTVIQRAQAVENEIQAFSEDLESFLSEVRLAVGGELPSTSGKQFYEYPSFEAFMGQMLRVWNGVPRNEFEAVRLAVKFYIAAFEAGKEIAPGNQSIQAAYLIAELSRMVGDHDTARQYFNTTIKTGQSFINEIRGDRTRTALARKILEMAMAQGKKNLAEAK